MKQSQPLPYLVSGTRNEEYLDKDKVRKPWHGGLPMRSDHEMELRGDLNY